MSTSPESDQSPECKLLYDLKARVIQTVSADFMIPLQSLQQSTYLLACFGNTWEINTCLQHLHRIQEAVEQMNLLLTECLEVEKKA